MSGVIYDHNTMAKGCCYARRKVEFLDTAHSHGMLVIYHKPLRCLIAIMNCLPTQLEQEKDMFCHTRGIRSDISRLSANQNSVLEPPSV